MFKLDLEKAEESEIKLSTSIESSKKQESSRKTSTSALLTTPKPLTVWITTDFGDFFKRNLYTGQEATVRTGHGTTDWFHIGKGVHQGCILLVCLFNLYAEVQSMGLQKVRHAWSDLACMHTWGGNGYAKNGTDMATSVWVQSPELSGTHSHQHPSGQN